MLTVRWGRRRRAWDVWKSKLSPPPSLVDQVMAWREVNSNKLTVISRASTTFLSAARTECQIRRTVALSEMSHVLVAPSLFPTCSPSIPGVRFNRLRALPGEMFGALLTGMTVRTEVRVPPNVYWIAPLHPPIDTSVPSLHARVVNSCLRDVATSLQQAYKPLLIIFIIIRLGWL